MGATPPRPPRSPSRQVRAGAIPAQAGPRHGLARVLSKAGLCSRTEAARWIREGRVSVDGRVVRDPEHPLRDGMRGVQVQGLEPAQTDVQRRYLLLNKPRGLVTTTRDEQGRDTVYRCFDGAGLPWLAPVGRLDKASEGLLLFSNDPAWAARILDPVQGPDKTYHVQVDRIPDAAQLQALQAGIEEAGERLRARSATVLRQGGRNAWLEVVLDEGRNRQIRRLLAAFDIGVLRLVRVAIGPLRLGSLGKGQWRELEPSEREALAATGMGGEAR
ncbi:pseudouridine synthase [Pseudoxanthomonas jiangsuensis]|uniref:pseudouridine synthase n=1 Tax=Pseudoxanthomonas jiangsuensis TaxID=619688 RepID=UPI001390CDD5|nr:pseudouridine synthase [Pseudoxanthomonas jiangsuensis]KAF1691427.1 pseudouridine synthase [Pseudoxanthomonas jiangsuensis]